MILFREVGSEAASGYMLCDLALVARAQGDYDARVRRLDRALLAASRARRPPRHRGGAERPREPGPLARAVRAGPRVAGGGAGDPPRDGRSASHRDDPGMPGPARRAGRRPGRGAPAASAEALAIFAETEDGPGRPGMLLNLGNLELEAGEVDRALPILEEAGRAVSQPDDPARLGLADAAPSPRPLIDAAAPDEARARRLIEEARGEFAQSEDAPRPGARRRPGRAARPRSQDAQRRAWMPVKRPLRAPRVA